MKNINSKILVSVVVCTYNREKHIKSCLESLVNQTLPKKNFEIIVVDDGSTDATISIASKFPVKIIKHIKNKGLSAARNTGLDAAKGEIYVCFDDDCYADKNWLRNLTNAYNKFSTEELAGVAGFVKLTEENGVINKYMDETGYANPSPIFYVKSKSLFMRFVSYIRNMFKPSIQTNKKLLEVGEIWGANCSFPVSVLKAVNGWDLTLSGVEDTDLCDRIKKKFPNKKFMCTKEAVLYHDHKLNLQNFLIKPYSRGTAILKFYLQNAKIPPIFPFPLLIVAFEMLLLIVSPLYALIGLLVLPQLFYSWWFIKMISKRKAYMFLFPYLQCGYELFTILGLIKGALVNRKS